jgi:hypothetical protein
MMTWDMMPVFCEVAGIEPAELDGEELRAIFALILNQVGQPLAALGGRIGVVTPKFEADAP